MTVPNLEGTIDRRMLINYRVDPSLIIPLLPKPFEPKLYGGFAIVGLCLIRLSKIRPKGFPDFVGVKSENAAHRIAVRWNGNGELKEGVFILRRDTSSMFNALVGGRLFPGVHHRASFDIDENDNRYNVAFKSSDGTTAAVQAEVTESWLGNSVFDSLADASVFFQNGSKGFSPGRKQLDGMRLTTKNWKVKPLSVETLQSSFFDNRSLFPKGSIELDNALLMTDLKHDWQSIDAPTQGSRFN